MKTHHKIDFRNMAMAMVAAIFSFVAPSAMGQTTDHCIKKYGPDSTETLKQISLYRELFGQRKYIEAYENWQYVFVNAPCLFERTHAEGRTILNSRIDATQDKKRRQELIDTLMLMYDLRIRYFGKEAYVKGFKGRDMIKYKPENTQEGVKILVESIDGEGNNTSEHVINDLAVAYFNLWKEKKVSDDEMVLMYERLSGLCDYNIKANVAEVEKIRNALGEEADKDAKFIRYAKDAENWAATLGNVNSLFTPVLTCEKLISIYKPKLDKAPNDTALMTRIIGYLGMKNCTKDPFYLAVAEKMYETKPDAAAARALGEAFAGEKNLTKAAFYYGKSVAMESDPMRKSADYVRMARISYERKNCQEARQLALQAIQFNPNEGMAYIIIGDAYIMCASQCSDAFEQKSVYWAAVDKYQKARSVDASVAGQASEKISLYSKYFPAKEECFFRGITEGQSFTLPCWPNESTTVRF